MPKLPPQVVVQVEPLLRMARAWVEPSGSVLNLTTPGQAKHPSLVHPLLSHAFQQPSVDCGSIRPCESTPDQGTNPKQSEGRCRAMEATPGLLNM